MTSKWLVAEPIDVMIPSPTRAMIVSSVAPPISCWRFVRTVTRARILSSTPFLATADSVDLPLAVSGQSITLGLTLVWTASSTSRPAMIDRTGAVEVEVKIGTVGHDQRTDHAGHVTTGEIVRLQSLRAVKSGPRPACVAMIRACTIVRALTFRRLMPRSSRNRHRRLRPVSLKPELPIVEDKEEHRQHGEPDEDRSADKDFRRQAYGARVHASDSGIGAAD